MLLYMIRHGESAANKANVHAGWAQVPLSPLGREQARAVGEKLKGVPFDRVFSSDLLRAEETCRIALPGISYETSPLLREVSVGDLSGMTADECEKLYGAEYLTRRAVPDFTPYGGEDLSMLTRRVERFLSAAELFTEKTVAVFAHAGVLRSSFELVMGTRGLRQKLYCGNGCIAVFEFTDKKWRLNAWNI